MKTSAALSHRNSATTTRTSLALAVVVALCGTGALAVGATPSDASPFTTVAHAAELRQGDAVIGILPMKQPIHIEVALKLRDKDGLDTLIANNANNQAHGLAPQLLTSEQFLATHAPTQAQAQAVVDYLARMGFTNIAIAPNRLLVSADGTAMTARNAFLTTFAQVRTHDGRTAFANTDAIRIPATLSDKVLAVVGLQTVHIPHTFVRALAPDAAHINAIAGHVPTKFPSIYGVASSAAASDVYVGIVTEGALAQTKSDLATFAANNSLPAVATLIVNTNGTSTDTSGTTEWDLDSQDIVGMAGQVKQLIFYNIPALLDSDLTADFNTIVAANKAKIINVSLGGCETDAKNDGSAAADDAIFQTAVAQGQTFSISTGDTGADECGNKTNTPSWPASSKYVIAAAGTTLNSTATTWSSETVWNRSGGSPSTFETIPSWQTALGIAGTKRVAADIAFDGDPNSGAQIIVNGKLVQAGGTSLSAPLFAGVWARMLHKYPTIGFAGPVIYALPTAAFHDITSGTNSGGETGIGFTAKVGYDDASGRGSMIIGTAITDASGLGNKAPVANFSFTISGLTANFSDKSADSDGTIASHAWKFGDGATSTAASPSHTYAANGTYSVSETVKDKVGASATKTESVTIGTGLQLLGNTGFETGTATPWAISPASELTNNASLAHVGNWFAAIGGTVSTTDRVSQTVAIPSGKTSATLSFFLRMSTAETSTTVFDYMKVAVYNTSGVLLGTLASYSNAKASSFGGYAVQNLNMTPYIGQTVSLRFVGVNNATLPTTWDIDDVTLTVN